MMQTALFTPQKGGNGKRARDDDEELGFARYAEHRGKRRQLPFRQSPESLKRNIQSSSPFLAVISPPNIADITPVASDSEDVPRAREPRSCFSPWSSMPGTPSTPSNFGSQLSFPGSSLQPLDMDDAPSFSGDEEMTESPYLQINRFHDDPSSSLAGRVPTPIHASFSHHRLDVNARPRSEYRGPWGSFAEDMVAEDRGRRLPSPVSEDETSSQIIESMEGMQMEVEAAEEFRVTSKKGHSRSKHSLRHWGLPNVTSAPMAGGKRFTMGFRADCEKCQNKVPGHYSHIVDC